MTSESMEIMSKKYIMNPKSMSVRQNVRQDVKNDVKNGACAS